MRKAFTLVELMVSIAILSIIILFLYKSYAELTLQNKHYTKAIEKIRHYQKLKKLLYLDILLSKEATVRIEKEDAKIDFVFFQTKNSVFDRINPYVAYIVKEQKLYRVESLTPLTMPLSTEQRDLDIMLLGEVKHLRLYADNKKSSRTFLLDVALKNFEPFVLKIKPFGW